MLFFSPTLLLRLCHSKQTNKCRMAKKQICSLSRTASLSSVSNRKTADTFLPNRDGNYDKPHYSASTHGLMMNVPLQLTLFVVLLIWVLLYYTVNKDYSWSKKVSRASWRGDGCQDERINSRLVSAKPRRAERSLAPTVRMLIPCS